MTSKTTTSKEEDPDIGSDILNPIVVTSQPEVRVDVEKQSTRGRLLKKGRQLISPYTEPKVYKRAKTVHREQAAPTSPSDPTDIQQCKASPSDSVIPQSFLNDGDDEKSTEKIIYEPYVEPSDDDHDKLDEWLKYSSKMKLRCLEVCTSTAEWFIKLRSCDNWLDGEHINTWMLLVR